MTPHTPPGAEQNLETSLDYVTQAVQSWDPELNPDVQPLLEALRALQLRFDPRKDRLSSALCVTSMKLLEQIAAAGSVGPAAAVSVVGELTRGLSESLSTAQAAPAVRPGAPGNMVTLQASEPKSSGLSLSIGSVEDQKIGELMVRMNMLSQEQVDQVLEAQSKGEPRKLFGEVAIELGFASEWTVDNALRLQQRGRGEKPAAEASGGDPWGNSPL